MSDEATPGQSVVKPLFTVNLESDDAVLNWCKNALYAAVQSRREFIRKYKEHLLLYRGKHWQNESGSNNRRSADSQVAPSSNEADDNTPDITVNHIFDLTQQRVARMSRFKPVVQVSPANPEDYSDKIAARRVKEYLDYLSYRDELELKFTDADLVRFIGAESYMWVDFKEEKGDLDPAFKALKEKKDEGGNAVPIPLVNEEGEQVEIGGQPIFIEKNIYQGDVDFEVVTPDLVFPQPGVLYENSHWIFRQYTEDADVLSAKYKGKTISADDGSSHFDEVMVDGSEDSEKQRLLNQVRYWVLTHKKTEFLPNGFTAKFTESTLLEKGPHPETHGDFPCERIVDIIIPNEQPMSNYENLRSLNGQINMIETMKTKNHIKGSHLHWSAPQGMTKKERMGNGDTVLWYRGMQEPRLNIFPVITRDMNETQSGAESNMQKISGIFSVSRGEPPPGIKAYVAMNFLEEQENERANADVVAKSKFILRVYKKALKVAACHYDPADPRVIRVMGREGRFESKKFDVVALNKDWDIRLQNSTTLPQSKAGRMQALLEFDERRPGVIGTEQFIDFLDLGGYADFTSELTKSLRAAQYENELLLDGDEVKPPDRWEDLLTHWKVHKSGSQSSFFKYELPPEIRDRYLSHWRTTEFLMIEKAKRSPQFAAMLAQLPDFPCVFVPPVMMAPQMPMEGGQAPMAGPQMMPNLPPDDGGESEVAGPFEDLESSMI